MHRGDDFIVHQFQIGMGCSTIILAEKVDVKGQIPFYDILDQVGQASSIAIRQGDADKGLDASVRQPIQGTIHPGEGAPAILKGALCVVSSGNPIQ